MNCVDGLMHNLFLLSLTDPSVADKIWVLSHNLLSQCPSDQLDKYQQLYIDNSNCKFSNVITIYHAVYLHLVIVNSHLRTISDECLSLLCDCGAIFLAILVLFYMYLIAKHLLAHAYIKYTHT